MPVWSLQAGWRRQRRHFLRNSRLRGGGGAREQDVLRGGLSYSPHCEVLRHSSALVGLFQAIMFSWNDALGNPCSRRLSTRCVPTRIMHRVLLGHVRTRALVLLHQRMVRFSPGLKGRTSSRRGQFRDAVAPLLCQGATQNFKKYGDTLMDKLKEGRDGSVVTVWLCLAVAVLEGLLRPSRRGKA